MHSFGAEASLPLTQSAPAVSHHTTRLYWMVFVLYECHIRSDAVTVLFWIFFIYSFSSAGECPSLVKNVEVEFEIKLRRPISRRNMSVDQPFLTLCSRMSSYFSNLHWCAQPMLTPKGIVNSVMITFFELTDQLTRSGRWRVDVISLGKLSRWYMSAITRQSVQLSSNVGLCLFLCGVFETFLSNLSIRVWVVDLHITMELIPHIINVVEEPLLSHFRLMIVRSTWNFK